MRSRRNVKSLVLLTVLVTTVCLWSGCETEDVIDPAQEMNIDEILEDLSNASTQAEVEIATNHLLDKISLGAPGKGDTGGPSQCVKDAVDEYIEAKEELTERYKKGEISKEEYKQGLIELNAAFRKRMKNCLWPEPVKRPTVEESFKAASKALQLQEATTQEEAIQEVADGFGEAGGVFLELEQNFENLRLLPGTPADVASSFAKHFRKLANGFESISVALRGQREGSSGFREAAVALEGLSEDMRNLPYPSVAEAMETTAAHLEQVEVAFGDGITSKNFLEFFKALETFRCAVEEVWQSLLREMLHSMEQDRAELAPSEFTCPYCHYIRTTTWYRKKYIPQSCENWHILISNPTFICPEAGIYMRFCTYKVEIRPTIRQSCYVSGWDAWWGIGATDSQWRLGATRTETKRLPKFRVAVCLSPEDDLPEPFEMFDVDVTTRHHDQGGGG